MKKILLIEVLVILLGCLASYLLKENHPFLAFRILEMVLALGFCVLLYTYLVTKAKPIKDCKDENSPLVNEKDTLVE